MKRLRTRHMPRGGCAWLGQGEGGDVQQQEGVSSPCRATAAAKSQHQLWEQSWGFPTATYEGQTAALLPPPSEASHVLTNSFGSCGAVGGDSTGEDVLCSQVLLCCTSATLTPPNYKTDDRNLWRPSGPTSLLKVGTTMSSFWGPFLGWVGVWKDGDFTTSLDTYPSVPLLEWRLTPVFQCVPILSCPVTGHHRKEHLHHFTLKRVISHLSFRNFSHKAHLKPSLLYMKPSHLFEDRIQLQGMAIQLHWSVNSLWTTTAFYTFALLFSHFCSC